MKKILLVVILLLSACNTNNNNEIYYDYIAPLYDIDGNMVLPLNTTIKLTMKDKEELDKAMKDISNIIYEYHMLFDAYHDYEFITNLKSINDSYGTGEKIAVSKELYDLLEEAVTYTKLSEGKFNLTIGSLYNAYRPLFSNIPIIHKDPDISEAKSCVVGYRDIDNVLVMDKKGQTIEFKSYPMCNQKVEISLGAISKGYICDKVVEYLNQLDTYYLLDIGSSNIYGSSDDDIKVGIRSFYDMNDFLFPIKLESRQALSTSGDNNNFYLIENEDGNTVIRSHIIDTELGYSPNYYRNVSVICDSNLVADLMSTILFLCKDNNEVDKYINIFNEYFDEDIAYALIREEKDKELKLICDNTFYEHIIDGYMSEYIKEEEVRK